MFVRNFPKNIFQKFSDLNLKNAPDRDSWPIGERVEHMHRVKL